jgi:site-specific DNA-methyltransferase (adenine-specific)
MQRGRFSSSAEYIVYASNGVLVEGELSPQNVLAMQGVSGEEKQHIAEKPIDLIVTLLGVTPPDTLIVDPFCGIGTTCRAAQLTGRRFIGIDISEQYCQIARERLKAVETGVPVKEARQGQKALFDSQ